MLPFRACAHRNRHSSFIHRDSQPCANAHPKTSGAEDTGIKVFFAIRKLFIDF